MFEELFPFGGKLDENNRWLKIAEMILWEQLEQEYSRHFTTTDRPAEDVHLVIGLPESVASSISKEVTEGRFLIEAIYSWNYSYFGRFLCIPCRCSCCLMTFDSYLYILQLIASNPYCHVSFCIASK